MTEIMHSNPISLAVWDVPMPVVAGEQVLDQGRREIGIRPCAGRPRGSR